MNNLKAAREEIGISQKELATILQTTDPRIDQALVSKFETGVCLPNPITARNIARLMHSSVRDLFGEVEPLPFEVEDLLHALGDMPKTRGQLCEELDVGDRELRRLIREARDYGYVIVNKGKGYYLATTEEDMTAFYNTEHARAMSILRGLSILRKHLKTMGVNV